ncbi:MAG: hypothetical protein FWH17_03300 [Oscillospiraceae bacterium]|nr:hypothetical protein [Oscillospiraceae bacterium]
MICKIYEAVIEIIPRAEHGCGASDRLRMDDATDRGGMILWPLITDKQAETY